MLAEALSAQDVVSKEQRRSSSSKLFHSDLLLVRALE
jgi:hypothetical protein